MGCICAKPSAVEAIQESPKERLSRKESSDAHVLGANYLKRDGEIEEKYKLDGGDMKFMLIDKKVNGSASLDAEVQIEKKNIQKLEIGGVDYPGKGSVPKALEGEQVAAGWPAWLAAVTGEAIKGWVPRGADTFEKLEKIGEGTYSNVYKARDLLHNKIVALKKVRFDNLDPESIKFMAREIVILRRLDHPNIVKLDGLITSRTSCSLYLIFEYMEHDLTGLGSLPGIKFTQPQIKCYMHQLLSGLDHCHSRGVLHRDIKGSNLLIDNNGILKIADFGLASFFNSHHSVPLTSRVVTLWYRPPELLLGASHYGVAIDLWSTGCILGELYAGKPILPGRTEVEQLHKIFKLCGSPSEDYWRKSKLPHSTVFKPLEPYRRCLGETFKDYSATAVELMDTLLSIDPAHRGSATSALASEFFTSQPLPCDPSSLPKYPPSKEIDAKLRDKSRKIVPCATRQGAVRGSRGQMADMEKAGPRKFWEIPARTANAGLTTLAQKIHSHSNSKSRSEIFNSHREQAASRTLIDPLKQTQGGVREGSKDFSKHPCKNASQSGSLVQGTRWAKSGKEFDDPPMVPAGANLSTLSGFVSTRTLPSEVCQEKPGTSQAEGVNRAHRSRRSINESESVGKQDKKQHTPRIANSQQQMGDAQINTKEPVPRGRDSRENKIYVSGSLLVPSNNVDQMLKEHDLRIQEFARRARFEKKRVGKIHTDRILCL